MDLEPCLANRPWHVFTVNMLTVEKQWINVQQKTFTKWFALPAPPSPRHQLIEARLNDKLKARTLSIEDLVTDLSDGVSAPFHSASRSALDN